MDVRPVDFGLCQTNHGAHDWYGICSPEGMTLIINAALSAAMRELNADTDHDGLVMGQELRRAARRMTRAATTPDEQRLALAAEAAAEMDGSVPTLSPETTHRLESADAGPRLINRARAIASEADRYGDNNGEVSRAEVRRYCTGEGLSGPACRLAEHLRPRTEFVVIIGPVQNLRAVRR